jgi:myo-inositol-1-phosphate synthase
MAKITAEFDTITKKLTVALDGVAFDNVNSVSFYESYCEEGEHCASIGQREKLEDEGMVKYTYISASENGDVKVSEPVEEVTKGLAANLFKGR